MTALVLTLGWTLSTSRAERRALELEESAVVAARSGEVEETLALLAGLDEQRGRPIRALLLDSILAPLTKAADAAPLNLQAVGSAHARADALIASHGESWPALVRALEPVVARLRTRREVGELAQPLRSAASEAGFDLPVFESRMREAGREARRLGDDAVRELSRELRGAWDRALLSAAREDWISGRPAQAVATLDREFPLLSEDVPAQPVQEPRLPSHAPVGAPAEQLAALEAAWNAHDLEGLRRGVEARAGEDWPSDLASRLEATLPSACRALASLGASRAFEVADPAERLSFLLAALTCDELLPPAFLEDAGRAIAEQRVAIAEQGGELPAPRSLAGRGELLARLACAATAAGDDSAALGALRLLDSTALLEVGLTCALSPPAPSAAERATWPSLDYPSPSAGGEEELR